MIIKTQRWNFMLIILKWFFLKTKNCSKNYIFDCQEKFRSEKFKFLIVNDNTLNYDLIVRIIFNNWDLIFQTDIFFNKLRFYMFSENFSNAIKINR